MATNDESFFQHFVRIIDAQEEFSGRKCVTTINKDEIPATILGKHFRVTTFFHSNQEIIELDRHSA